MADQEPRTGPPTREASKMRGVSEPRDREPRSHEPHKSENSGKRNPPFGLKPGLLAGVTGKIKFWITFFAGVLGLFVIIVSWIFLINEAREVYLLPKDIIIKGIAGNKSAG